MKMNYTSCPVFVRNGLGEEINAFGLLNLSKSGKEPLLLSFSRFTDFSDGFDLEFFRTSHFSESLFNQIKDLDLQCFYEAIDFRGEQSVFEFIGIIRHNGNQFIFGHLNEKLYFFRDSPNCEWHVRNRRSGEISLTKRMPTYYSEYTDGIKRWVELIVIADNSIYKKYGEDKKRITERLHAIASSVNSLYAPLNIRVILTWADIWQDKNAVDVTENADGTLRDFSWFS
uniref:Peptidase M12B domain-containing protein n=1 Tax=Meloidogyne enterolobii TaxID=390850 RepID=A0A6V7TJJ5_MELEN|nr:unnamed protein product [Meloidogyne enterolobii]